MTIDRDTLMSTSLPTRDVDYSEKDVMLYALSLGLGAAPTDAQELRLVTESDLHVLPSFATILTFDIERSIKLGLNRERTLHGEQRISLLRPLPTRGKVRVRDRVIGVFDKGDKGALVVTQQTVHDRQDDSLIATTTATIFDRSGGGCGSSEGEARKPHVVPDRAPDETVDTPTLPQQALLYRLNGDFNPLHSDPDFAKRGGFERPILHGLCTYGIASVAVLRACGGLDPNMMIEFDARFTAPVIPGETLRTEIWRGDEDVSYRTRALERDVVVLDNGRALLTG